MIWCEAVVVVVSFFGATGRNVRVIDLTHIEPVVGRKVVVGLVRKQCLCMFIQLIFEISIFCRTLSRWSGAK